MQRATGLVMRFGRCQRIGLVGVARLAIQVSVAGGVNKVDKEAGASNIRADIVEIIGS